MTSHSVDRGKDIFAQKCDEKKKNEKSHITTCASKREVVMRSKFSPNRGLPVRRIHCSPDNRSNASQCKVCLCKDHMLYYVSLFLSVGNRNPFARYLSLPPDTANVNAQTPKSQRQKSDQPVQWWSYYDSVY